MTVSVRQRFERESQMREMSSQYSSSLKQLSQQLSATELARKMSNQHLLQSSLRNIEFLKEQVAQCSRSRIEHNSSLVDLSRHFLHLGWFYVLLQSSDPEEWNDVGRLLVASHHAQHRHSVSAIMQQAMNI